MCQAHAAVSLAACRLDPQVLQTLLNRKDQFRRFVARRLRDEVATDEVLQDAFLKSIERLAELRDPNAAVAWFYRILRNAVNDRFLAWETARRRSVGVEEVELEAEQLEAERPCGCVHHALGGLKPEYAAVIRAVELGGRPLNAWAAENGITPNNAGVRVFRARKALLHQVRHECGACAEDQCRQCTCDHEIAA